MDIINTDPAQENELIVFYNTENFYFPDENFSTKRIRENFGLVNWNQKRFQNKLFKIAHVFQLLKEKHTLPMLIGLSEVQGEKVLQELVAIDPFNSNFGIVHYESMDERGVDVALLYDKSKIEIIHSEPISFFFEIEDEDPDNYDTTRDILFCKAKYKEKIINIFVFHLPSKRENDVNKPKRNHIINSIKEKIQEISEKGEAVILCGDFNENPDEENLKNIVYDKNSNKILVNPSVELFASQKFSTFHYNFGLLFDQILISNDFFNENFPLQYESAEVFSPEEISNWDKKFKGRPFRTYAGTRYLGGYSDHFPVFVKFGTKN